MEKNNSVSSGHKLGQIVGDWYEEFFALPILKEICQELDIYLDHRFKSRACRREKKKIIWNDSQGNSVDYDFVLEINGTDQKIGTPVAFFETFYFLFSAYSRL